MEDGRRTKWRRRLLPEVLIVDDEARELSPPGLARRTISQRSHEFGLRMALGARPADVQRLVVGQGLKLASMGVALGLLGALALGRVMWSLLFEVSATDPATFISVAAAAIAVAALACYLPARRATAVDPANALRSE